MNFEKKFEVFWQFFHDNGGYTVVLEGLRNTLIIAVLGLVIGIIIGTLIATARVVPKTNPLVKILDWIARLYVSFFRGTPIVVQLLLFYYVLMPLLSINLKSVPVAVVVFGLNSGAYISEIMRAGILSVDSGQMEGGRLELWHNDDKNYHSAGCKKHFADIGQRVYFAYQGNIGCKLCRCNRPLSCIPAYRLKHI